MKNISVQKPKSAFGVNDSLALKGIAIILMLLHHCFRLQSRMDKYGVITWPFEVSTIVDFSGMFKICVSIFAFITGYGLYLSAKKKCTGLKESESWIVNRLVKTLSGFWFVYILVFIVTQIYADYPQGIYCDEGYTQGIVWAAIDFLGLANLMGTPTLVGAWWYMSAAIIFIVAIPVMIKWIDKFGTVSLIIIIMALPRIIGDGFPGGNSAYTFLFPVLLGLLFAKYDLFQIIDEIKFLKNKYVNGILVFLVMGTVFVSATYTFFQVPVKTFWEYNYGIYAAIFICFFKKYIVRIPLLDKFLAFVGKHSMNVFLIHTFIQSIFFMDFIFSFKHFLLIAGVLFGISLAISVFIIEPLKKLVRFDKLMDKLSNKPCAAISK